MDPSAESFTSAVRFDTSLTLAALTILYYDYALTVTTEIEYYWNPPSLTPSFILYAISRYFGLLGPIPVFFEYFGEFSEYRWGILIVVTVDLGELIVFSDVANFKCTTKLLLILRTYALYNCNKRMLVLLVVSYVGGGVQSLGAVLTTKTPLTNASDAPLGFAYTGCNLALTNNQGVHLALGWSAMLWFDALIFGLTFYKAIQVRREISGGLLVTMFRDGTVYFAILVAVNMVNIITFLVTPVRAPYYVCLVNYELITIAVEHTTEGNGDHINQRPFSHIDFPPDAEPSRPERAAPAAQQRNHSIRRMVNGPSQLGDDVIQASDNAQ